MSAGSLSSSSYLVPGIAVLLSWWLLGEVPTPLALVGGALCLIGVAVTRLPPNALLHILGKKSGPRAGL
jgi:drug/metabolite transporter (DMT)-like permease